ncbi:MAG: hypothetical protein KF756_08610 [Acidobacteria bacterium]|nr:hypothetical protein [Acidobacteriota bacterium]
MVSTTRLLILLFLFLSGSAILYAQDVKSHKDSPVKFEVLSVRLASPEERQSDNIGADVIVRLRLSNKGRTTVYFYTSWKRYISPEGYTIRFFENRIEWFVGLEETAGKSPGIERLVKSGDGGEWLALTKGTAIEFELFDSTARTRGKHAQTFFSKVGDKGIVSEVYSDFYEVPTKAP